MTTLYISDLDGTLLRNDATLSDYSEQVLREMLTKGLQFTVASARGVITMREMLRGLPLPLPVIGFNGAFLSDIGTCRHEVVNSLEPDVAESVFELATEYGLVPFMSTFDGVNDRVHYGGMANDGMTWWLNDRLAHRDPRWGEPSTNLADSLREQVVCLTMIADRESLAQLQIALLDRHAGWISTHLFINQYCAGWFWLTVHDRRATKDQAVRTLVERYGLESHEIVAFGDQDNDLPMFRIADRAVAVGNASNEVQRMADVVIGTNEDDSVVKFIAKDSRPVEEDSTSYRPKE